jgi:hypothetical protein
MKIAVSAEVETWDSRAADPDDSWDRGDTSGRVTNVLAFPDKGPSYSYGDSIARDLDVKFGDTVYAVVADYESGDTFGRSGGHAQVLDVFLTEAEAAALVEAAKDVPKGDEMGRYGFTHNEVDYHRSWVGYFESLNDLDVWAVEVRPHPSDPIKKGPGRYSLKRGH